MNIYDKSSRYSKNNYEFNECTPMSSSQQFITSEFSNNMVPPTTLSTQINENTHLEFHVPQMGNFN